MASISKIVRIANESAKPLSINELAQKAGVHHSVLEKNMRYLTENGLRYTTLEDWLACGK
ncbi:MAG: hypothetical protein ABH834_05915 [Candidatus Altiarchaeota archaeon]